VLFELTGRLTGSSDDEVALTVALAVSLTIGSASTPFSLFSVYNQQIGHKSHVFQKLLHFISFLLLLSSH